MKTIASISIIAALVAATGCVSRTVTEEPTFSNPKTKNQYGGQHTKTIDKKTYWFWQSEFWNKDDR